MPLTKKGQMILKDYKSRYGKLKGVEYFYATINKDPERTRTWHIR